MKTKVSNYLNEALEEKTDARVPPSSDDDDTTAATKKGDESADKTSKGEDETKKDSTD